jgi:hypothetical protein
LFWLSPTFPQKIPRQDRPGATIPISVDPREARPGVQANAKFHEYRVPGTEAQLA